MIKKIIVNFLTKKSNSYFPKSTFSKRKLFEVIQFGDVILVEGNTNFSRAIQHVTKSTWTHCAIYLGDCGFKDEQGEVLDLLEADIDKGVQLIRLEEYSSMHIRICRPKKINEEQEKTLKSFFLNKIGLKYDLKHIIQLLNYSIFPVSPLYFFKRLKIGSGRKDLVICSTIIAEAFSTINHPVIPFQGEPVDYLKIIPKDFDISPYFAIIKPSLIDT